MEKVLHVFHHLNNAGTEMVMLNLFQNINREEIEFDFLVFEDGENEKVFKDLGANIYKIKENNSFYELIRFFKKNDYKIVHIHMCSMMYVAVLAARIARISNIIVHSHNGFPKINILSKIKRAFLDLMILSYATKFFACSEIAAKYLFPIHYKKTEVLYNGICVEKFKYDNQIRINKRKEFGFSIDDLLIINVGRLEEQKNQRKIIDIAECDMNSKHKYIIIGNGTLKKALEEKIDKNKLNKKVFIFDNRRDINELLFMSDIFLLTSKFEGLGIVLIEAQTAGLRVLASDAVPEEADLRLGNFWKLNLNQSDKIWCEKINEIYNNEIDRENIYSKIMDTDYDIKKVSKNIEEFYLKLK